ncbi:MAG: peptidase domain-containing ABC transporter [Cyanobacteriota bacterium]|nr:peptidase domain-containing ABC transporter [Cyanobacteriota bacterium]
MTEEQNPKINVNESRILKLIEYFQPFKDLDVKEKIFISQNSSLVKGKIGQTLLRAEEATKYIYLIVEGRIRIVGKDLRTEDIETIELCGPGQSIGWVGVLRGRSCETALCSSSVIALRVEKNIVSQIFTRSKMARKYWSSHAAKAELFEATSTVLKRHPDCNISTLNIIEKALPSYRICLANKNNADELEQIDYLWYVSGGQEHGRVLDDDLSNLFKERTTCRLVGINKSELKKYLAGEKPDITQKESTVQLFDEIRDLEEENLEIIEEDIEPEYIEDEDEVEITYRKGKGPVEGSAACLRMLCETLGLPIKREMILRILQDQTRRYGGITLPLAGAICETIGLRTQITSCKANEIHKLELPALMILESELIMIASASNTNCRIAVPSKGIADLELEDIIGDEKTIQILLTTKTDQTPEDNFSLKWFLPSLGKYRVVLGEVLLSSLFVQLFGLANPLLIQQIIDKVIINNAPGTLATLGTLLILFAVIEVVLQSVRTFLFVDTTNRIDVALGSKVIDHMLKLPLKFFDKRPVGELSNRIGELENIRKFLTGTALTAVLDAVFALLYVFVMIIYSWQLTLVTVAVIPALIGVTYYFSPKVRKQIQAKSVAAAKTQSHLVEVLSGIQTVKSQGIELRTRWKWQDLYVDYVSDGFGNTVIGTANNSISTLINKTSSLMVVWMGAALVVEGKMTMGGMIAFRMIAGFVTTPVLRLSQIWQNFQEINLSMERLGDILNHPQETGSDELKKPMVPNLEGEIEYQDIWFRYNPSAPFLLKGLNLKIPAGSFVAIVGLSGSGKSTATKLLPRLYEPEKGKILVDNMDISKLELYSLRKQIGIVPQDTLLFDGSISENITLTNPSASQDEIDEAVEISCSDEFIRNLPAKYDTKVGERGSNLSGGQRQRLAIARTILQKPSVLIMDEATSALDYQTERRVSENLMKKLKGQTVLYVTHRLSSIVNADIIVLMGSGEVVEMGNHDELLSKKGAYHSLFTQQAAKMG